MNPISPNQFSARHTSRPISMFIDNMQFINRGPIYSFLPMEFYNKSLLKSSLSLLYHPVKTALIIVVLSEEQSQWGINIAVICKGPRSVFLSICQFTSVTFKNNYLYVSKYYDIRQDIGPCSYPQAPPRTLHHDVLKALVLRQTVAELAIYQTS